MKEVNFQTMPKHFMVWDSEVDEWICISGTE